MEVLDKRSVEGEKPEAQPQEIYGTVAGFQPAWNRVLIRRQKETDQLGGGLIRAQAYTEVSSRGEVIAVGPSDIPIPPVGSVATFSKYAECKEFDDAGDTLYAMPYAHDVHGWHNVPAVNPNA